MRGWALSVVLALAGCRTAPGAPAEAGAPVVLTPVDGAGLLEAVRAQRAPLTVVNVWATWCAPCVAELPELIEVGRDYADRGLVLALVSTDFPEQHAAAAALLQRLQAPLPTYVKVGSDAAFIDALSPEWSGSLPATFLYSPDGACVGHFEGPLDRGALEQILAAVEWSAPPPGLAEEHPP
jgi:thiol-disulfide isomerase/thioredoxin